MCQVVINNKLLKQNYIMLLYITSLIDELNKNIKLLEKEYSYRNKYLDIRIYREIKQCLERCLEEVFKDELEKDKKSI